MHYVCVYAKVKYCFVYCYSALFDINYWCGYYHIYSYNNDKNSFFNF